jgi:hypothetical protein
VDSWPGVAADGLLGALARFGPPGQGYLTHLDRIDRRFWTLQQHIIRFLVSLNVHMTDDTVADWSWMYRVAPAQRYSIICNVFFLFCERWYSRRRALLETNGALPPPTSWCLRRPIFLPEEFVLAGQYLYEVSTYGSPNESPPSLPPASDDEQDASTEEIVVNGTGSEEERRRGAGSLE